MAQGRHRRLSGMLDNRRQFDDQKGTISHHMKELLRAGLIRARRVGQYKHYEVCRDTIKAYSNELMRRLVRAGAGAD